MILVLAVTLVMLMASLAWCLTVVSSAATDVQVRDAQAVRAKILCETGIDHMRLYLHQRYNPQSRLDGSRPWDPVLKENDGIPPWSVEPVVVADGSYRVRVLDNADENPDPYVDTDGIVEIEVLAESGGSRIALRTIVRAEVHDQTDPYGILTGGDLTMNGSVDIEMIGGLLARVHTNEDLSLAGKVGIEGEVTAAGTASASGSSYTIQGVTGGPLQSNQVPVQVDVVDPALFRPFADFVLTASGQMKVGKSGLVLFDYSLAQDTSFQGFKWSASGGWSTSSNGPYLDGMYYVEGSIDASHGGSDLLPWKVTFVAERDIVMSGSPTMKAFYNSTELLVAGGDIRLTGGGNASLTGLLLAHEQIELGGSLTLTGRFVAESALNRPGSAVDSGTNPGETRLHGNVTIAYSQRVARSFGADVRLPVLSWSEELDTNVEAPLMQ